ncbi:MAG: hypothetical protein OEW05_13185 [Candidatus Aminicenantes bacterium]|nr:hypothetical protein [Candidatus Aminicenantes bacterium]
MNTSKRQGRRKFLSRGKGFGLFLLVLLCVTLAGHLLAQSKKLQVAVEEANLYLDPDAKSPIVMVLPRGAILTLASSVKFRHDFLYAFAINPETGKTRSGYILEEAVRKLFPEVNSTDISSDVESTEPKEFNLSKTPIPVWKWGMTKARLLDLEGRPLAVERKPGGEIIQYARTLLDKRCLVEYLVAQNRLVAVRYHLMDKYTDKNRYIQDYYRLKAFVVQQLGEPKRDESLWLDFLHRNNAEQWGTAVSQGQLEFRAEWVVKDTDIMLTLAGSDNMIAFGAQFSAPSFKTSASF